MATQFETQAIIRLIDEVSGPLRKLSGSISDYNAAAARAHRQIAAEQGALQRAMAVSANAAWDATKIKIAEVVDYSVRRMHEVGMMMEKANNNLKMFTSLSSEEVDKSLRYANTSGSWVEGGPVAFRRAQMEAYKAGIHNISDMNMTAEFGAIYARMAGQDPGHGTRELIQHMMVMGELHTFVRDMAGNILRDEHGRLMVKRDADGKEIEPTTGTVGSKDLEDSLRLTLGRMAMLTKNVTGWTMEDTFNYFKNFGPTARAQHVEWNQAAALAATLAEKGFSGEVAGNAMASAYGRLTSPKGPGRQAIAAAGLNWATYATIDPSALTASGFIEGIKIRIGKEHFTKENEADVHRIVAEYQRNMVAAGANTDPEARRSIEAEYTKELRVALTDLLIKTGDKRLSDSAKAGTFVNTFMANAVQDINMMSLLAEAKKRSLGIGFYNAIFGLDRGKQVMAISLEKLMEMEERFRKMSPEKRVGEIQKELNSSYEKAIAEMKGSLDGMFIAVFEPLKPALAEMARWVTSAANAITNASSGVRAAIGGGLEVGKYAIGLYALVKARDFLKALVGRGGAAAAGGVFGSEIGAAAAGATAATGFTRVLALAAPATGAAIGVAAAYGFVKLAVPALRDLGVGRKEQGIDDSIDYRKRMGKAPTPSEIDLIYSVLDPGIAMQLKRMDDHEMGRKRGAMSEPAGKGTVANNIITFPISYEEMERNRAMAKTNPVAVEPPKMSMFDKWWERERTDWRQMFDKIGSWFGGSPEPKVPQQQQPSNIPTQKPFAFPDMLNVKSEVTGEVKGEVSVTNDISIHPSPEFMAEIRKAREPVKVPVSGNLGTSMSGTNGVTKSTGIGHM